MIFTKQSFLANQFRCSIPDFESGSEIAHVFSPSGKCGPGAKSVIAVSKMFVGNFFQALLAVLAGNLAYYWVMPYLPPLARHRPFATDWGVAVDFWFCLVAFGIVKWLASGKAPSHRSNLR